MKHSLYYRSTWGSPIELEPEIVAHFDDIFVDSPLMSHPRLVDAWDDRQNDVDEGEVITSSFFALALSDRNHKKHVWKNEIFTPEFLPVSHRLIHESRATVGEVAFIVSRYPMAFGRLGFMDLNDNDAPAFLSSMEVTRAACNKYEALAWTILGDSFSLYNRWSKRELEVLFAISGTQPDFDLVLSYLGAGVPDVETLISAIKNEVDPEYYRTQRLGR